MESSQDRLEPPSVTMVLKSKDATKSIKQSLANITAIVGLAITLFYIAIFVADIVYPRYLQATGPLSNAVTAFNGVYYETGYPAIAPFAKSGWLILGSTTYDLPILPVMLLSIKYDLAFASLTVLISAAIGTLAGLYAGTYGGLLDRVIVKISDFFFDVPFLAMAIFIGILIAHLSLLGLAIAAGIAWFPSFANAVRDRAREVASGGFAKSQLASGSSKGRLLFKHIFPNIVPDLGAKMISDLGVTVQILATIDFLYGFAYINTLSPEIFRGLHIVNPFLPELGNMIMWGSLFIGTGQWWPIVIPGLFLIGFIAGVNLLAAGVRKSIRYKRWKVVQ